MLALVSCACVSSQAVDAVPPDRPDDESGRINATWRFEFVDRNGKSMGHMLLVFTADKIDQPTCGNDDWQKMLVLEDNLDFDFGVDSRPAYSLHGPWLTIDLTSSVCYLDHILIGDMTPNAASGFFNLSHQIGGENIGRFTAKPLSNLSRDASDESVR